MKIILEGAPLLEDDHVNGVEFLTDDDNVFIQIEHHYVKVSKDDLLRVLKALE